MNKGKFGISPVAIAVLAFSFTAFMQPIPVLLLVGFALLAEKDEWLVKQALQALFLTVCYYVFTLAVDLVFGGLTTFFGWLHVYGLQSTLSFMNSLIDGLIYLAVIVLAVIAVINVLRHKDAGLPVLSKLAGGKLADAYARKAYPVPPYAGAAPAYTAPQQTAPQQAAPQPQPVYATQAAPAPAGAAPQETVSEASTAGTGARLCPVCSSPLPGDSRFCTQCGAKVD